MKIHFYAPMKPPDHPEPSGDRRMARLLIHALKLCGHEVTLAPAPRAYDGAGDPVYQQAIQKAASAYTETLIASPPSAWPDLWFTYHVYHKTPDWIGPAAARALHIPYVIVEASHAAKAASSAWALGHRGAELAIRSADLIFSITTVDKEGIAPLLSRRQAHLNLPPFLDLSAFAQRKRQPYPNGEPVKLLTAAMMRHDAKLESYRLLAEYLLRLKQQNWRLTIAGDGPARAEVAQALSPLGLERVNFLGQVDEADMPGIYAAADLFLWPAAGESYGMAMLEAQAAGLPVIAGRGRGVAEVVRDGETGFLTPNGDGEAFISVTDFLIADATARHKLGDAAAKFVRQSRSIDTAAGILGNGLAMLAPGAVAAGA